MLSLSIIVEIEMIQRKQDDQEFRENTTNLTMKNLHPHQTSKQNHPPPKPPTVTVNCEGGVGEEDRPRSLRNLGRMLLISPVNGKRPERRKHWRRRKRLKKNTLRVSRKLE